MCLKRSILGRFRVGPLFGLAVFLALLDPSSRMCGLRLLRQLAELREPSEFRFELSLSSGDLLREFFDCEVAQVRKLIDVHRIKVDLAIFSPPSEVRQVGATGVI
jgi:hypothetical protein